MTREFKEAQLESEQTEKVLEHFEWEGKECFVRYAQREDVGGLIGADKDRARFRLERYKVPMREFNDQEETERWEDKFSQPNMMILVLTVDGELAGYNEMGRSPDDPDVVQGHTLTVLEKYQGKKVFGPALFNSGIKQAKDIFNAKKFQLFTNEKNIPAIKLYKKAGFKQIGDHILSEGKTWGGEQSYTIFMEKDLEKD